MERLSRFPLLRWSFRFLAGQVHTYRLQIDDLSGAGLSAQIGEPEMGESALVWESWKWAQRRSRGFLEEKGRIWKKLKVATLASKRVTGNVSGKSILSKAWSFLLQIQALSFETLEIPLHFDAQLLKQTRTANMKWQCLKRFFFFF